MTSIGFEEPIKTWQEHNLLEFPVTFNEHRTWLKAIVRGEQLVAMVSKRYQLLPNEEAVKIADEAAHLAGLVPFNEFSGEWLKKMNDHVVYDKGDLKVHALYAINKSYSVNGEKMHVGVGVHNSIDGTMGFGCGIFTFRHACSNMVFAGMKGWEMSFDQRKTLDYLYRRHTGEVFKDLTGSLKPTIMAIMGKAQDVLQRYREMAHEDLTEQMMRNIRKIGLPTKALPDYLQVDIQQTRLEVPDKSVWEAYNDITQLIWHNEKTDVYSKTNQYALLHKAIPLLVKA